MANEVTKFNPAALPAFLKQREGTSTLGKALAGSGGMGYKDRLSIKGGVFRLVSGGKEIAAIEERYLDVVVIGATEHVGRIFYGQDFDEESVSAPKCQSDDGQVPNANVTEKQHDNCNSCPMNVKGSGKGDTKACRYYQRLALVLANDMEGQILQLVVPAKSLFGKEESGNYPLQAYARFLLSQNIGPDMVVTRVKFDTRESAPKLFFKPQRFLTDEEFALIEQRAQSEDCKHAVENIGTGAEPEPQKGVQFPGDDEDEAPAPAPEKPKRGRPKAATPPPPQDEDEEDAPPAKRPNGKSQAAPAPAKTSVASLAASWGETDD